MTTLQSRIMCMSLAHENKKLCIGVLFHSPTLSAEKVLNTCIEMCFYNLRFCSFTCYFFSLSSFSFLPNDLWLFCTVEEDRNDYASINMSLTGNVMVLIKDEHLLLYEFGSADSGWPPFSKGFALCSIISHYYMSHLLPKFPMGETTHTHTHTNDDRHVTHNSHRPLKSQQATHSGNWPRALPSTTTFTRLHNAALSEEEKITEMTPEQESLGGAGDNTWVTLGDITNLGGSGGVVQWGVVQSEASQGRARPGKGFWEIWALAHTLLPSASDKYC